jgi:hypothetical protein
MPKSRTSGDEAPSAPVPMSTMPYEAPRQFAVERRGSKTESQTRRWPSVHGGVCEFCGILDSNIPSQYQYKLCPHFRGMELRCSYCDENKDPDDVIYHSNLNIAAHPSDPYTMVVWCDSYECSKRHIERFKVNK